MDWEDLENKITPNTKFIIVSHHFGIPFPWENLKTIDKSIVILEDLNNGLGSKLNGELLGNKGLFAFFSLNFDKIITAVKGGGIIAKKHNYLKLMSMLDPKPSLKKPFQMVPLEFKLNDLNAALALSELSLIDKFINRRKEIADYYTHCVEKSHHSPWEFSKNIFYNHSFFPFFSSKRLSSMKSIFAKHGVEVRSITEGTIYETHLNEMEQKKLKNISRSKHNIVLVPLYPTLRKEEIERIGNLITLSG